MIERNLGWLLIGCINYYSMTTIHANYSLQSNNLFSLILDVIRITLIRSYYGQRDSTLGNHRGNRCQHSFKLIVLVREIRETGN